ncbi:MAG: uroporphyrinogen-III synthase [Myxococcota bacterium]|nr:uroporphyrinogen-III synthase [Myxococcota bacterium]
MRILNTCAYPEPFKSICENAGLESVHVPFIQHRAIVSKHPEAVPELVLISSARTAQYVENLREWVRESPVHAIGESTARSLLDIGVQVHFVANGSGRSLVESVNRVSCSSFWHVGAEILSSPLERSLRHQKRPFFRWKVYTSFANETLGKQILALPKISVTCLASPRAARLLKRHFTGPVVCIGQTTAEEALKLGLEVVGVAERTSKESLASIAVEYVLRYRR